MYRRNSQQFAIGTRVEFFTSPHTKDFSCGTIVGRADNYMLIVQLDTPLTDGSTAIVLDTKMVTII